MRGLVYTIGFFNRFRSFPAPVVLILNDCGKLLVTFPTGTTYKLVPGETEDSLTQYPEFQKLDFPIVIQQEGMVGFAFGSDDLFIGIPRDVQKEIHTRLRRKTLSDDTRAKLSLLVNQMQKR